MKIVDFIIADDVRQELGNKTSIMGIYTEDIILSPAPPKWPLPFRIGVYIRVLIEGDEKIPNKFALEIYQDEKKSVRMGGEINVLEKGKYLTLPLVVFPMPINGPGLMHFNFDLSYNDEKLIEGSNSIHVRVV